MRALLAALLLVLAAAAPAAAAKSYSAERYDSRIRVLPGGAIEVVETVVFRFEGGTFDHVFRNLPPRRTDGIDIVSAQMDGRSLAFGRSNGEVDVRSGSPVRVRWNFAQRADSTHTFVLTYIVRGVVRREAGSPGSDVLEWIALPNEHEYRIDSAQVVVEAPAPMTAAPVIESRRVNDASLEPAGQRIQVLARGIGKNGWVKVRMQFAEGSVIASAPAWQQRQMHAAAFAPQWAIAAMILFGVGLVGLFAMRQHYDSPPRFTTPPSSGGTPPDDARPAIAGSITSNGGVALQHAMATLFALADRRVISIVEEPRRWGQRHFTLHRREGGPALAPEETTVLDLAFRGKEQTEASVSLSQTRSRITRRLREFRKTVQAEMLAHGLLDPERTRIRTRYLVIAIVFIVVALVSIAPAAMLSRQYAGYPFLITGAIGALALAAFIFYGALTPLSNEGVRRAEEWRAYQRFLKDAARDRVPIGGEPPARLLPFAVALGLAGAWAKFVKHHPASVPPWFRALTATHDQSGFVAFIAAGGASGDGGAHGGGGGAGGGASGAG